VKRSRAAVALSALLLFGAREGDRVVKHPGGGPALIIPAGSPVRFTGFTKDGGARFSGRFELSGTFVYHCEVECEPGMKERDLSLGIVPDQALAKRMPHWRDRGDHMVVDLSRFESLRGRIVPARQVSALLAGKIPDIRGHMVVIASDYSADYGCDYSPYYSAHFVSLAKPPKLAKSRIEPDFGCA
jgi:hypothetical protein